MDYELENDMLKTYFRKLVLCRGVKDRLEKKEKS